VVGLNKISKTVSHGLEEKMNKFGANILIYPKTDEVTVSYGGVQLGSLSYEVKYLPQKETVDKILSIGFKKNISAVAPKLVKSYKINDKNNIGIVGVDINQEMKIKHYWHIKGKLISSDYELILGEDLARRLGKKVSDSLYLLEKR